MQRFLGDTGKCIMHLKGAADIMQRFSTPFQLCSTVLGRALLEWYCIFEDYYCFVTAERSMLPKSWRDANCQVRRKLAEDEYHRLSIEERRGRLLDDLWPEFYYRVTHLSDILARVSEVKRLN